MDSNGPLTALLLVVIIAGFATAVVWLVLPWIIIRKFNVLIDNVRQIRETLDWRQEERYQEEDAE